MWLQLEGGSEPGPGGLKAPKGVQSRQKRRRAHQALTPGATLTLACPRRRRAPSAPCCTYPPCPWIGRRRSDITSFSVGRTCSSARGSSGATGVKASPPGDCQQTDAALAWDPGHRGPPFWQAHIPKSQESALRWPALLPPPTNPGL